MMLSRIVRHLREQNWAAVGLEFLIVVLGVFIGMQVSNWNAAQAEKRLGREYSARMMTDLRNDLAAHQKVIDYYTVVLDSVMQANVLLRDADADPKQLIMHAYRASEIVNAPREGATWEEVVSTGDTGLLPRAALESGLSDYFAGDSMRDVYDRMRDAPYRNRLRSIIPIEVQEAIRKGCSDRPVRSQLDIGFLESCEIAVDERTLRATAAMLRADAQLAAELRLQYAKLVSSIGILRTSVLYLQRALAAFESDAAPAGAIAP